MITFTFEQRDQHRGSQPDLLVRVAVLALPALLPPQPAAARAGPDAGATGPLRPAHLPGSAARSAQLLCRQLTGRRHN